MECAFNILYMSRVSDVLLLAMLLAGPGWGSPGTRRKRSARRGCGRYDCHYAADAVGGVATVAER